MKLHFSALLDRSATPSRPTTAGATSAPLALSRSAPLRSPSAVRLGPLASPRGLPDTHRRPYGLQRAPWGRAGATGGQADQERGGEGRGGQATSCNALSEDRRTLGGKTSAHGLEAIGLAARCRATLRRSRLRTGHTARLRRIATRPRDSVRPSGFKQFINPC